MFWRKKRSLKDFQEEIQSHLSLEADEIEEAGGARQDAEAEARRAFGNVLQVKEDFYGYGRWTALHQFGRDVRHALRLIWRRPSFSVVVVLTLALGIGSNTAIFGVVNAVLLRQLPYKDPGRLAMLWSDDPAAGSHEGRVSLLNFAEWKKRSHTFEDMTLFGPQTFLLGSKDGPPERMRSARVFGNFFSLLGIEPLLGRAIKDDDVDKAEPVVVLSYGLWQRMGASEQVLGTDLTMDGRRMRIIGVMPASFHYPFDDTQVWEPITAHPYWVSRDRSMPRSFSVWYALGRARPEVAWADVQAEMSAIARQLASEYPEDKNAPDIRVVALPKQTFGRMRLPLLVLFGSVFLMLLIACANVANLLLANGSARKREFAVRAALGASRFRLAAQLLTESLVLSTAGGLLGLGIAAAALKALIAFGPHDIPRLNEAHIDSMVVFFTIGLCGFAAAVSALWPAMRTGTAIANSRSWNTQADRRLQDLLTTCEFAVALVLLAGAGLMIRSFVRLQAVDPGFEPEKLLAMRIDLHLGKTAEQQVNYFREVIQQAKTFPGVRSAGAVEDFLRSDPEESVEIEGRLPQRPGPCQDSIAGAFFQTAGIPLKEGRTFSDEDRRDSTPVAIINETMAKTYWPNEDAVGKRFRFPGQHRDAWITVVGVAGDMHRQGLEKRVVPQVFLPHTQNTDNMMDVIVRTSADPSTLLASLQSRIQSLDKTIARFKVVYVEQQLEEQTSERRFQTSLIGFFSAIALLLCAIGIYGLMHYLVVQRINEIGVRMALGARYGTVVKLILRQGLTLAGIGVIIGTAGALAVTRLFSNLLFGVSPTDLFTFVAAPVILLGVALLACWIPACRAARVDPLVALRHN